MKTRGHITCPRCGADVKVPLYWAVGIEGIFRCRECRLPFKTGYKMGAVLSALGLTLAVATVQLLVYLLSIYSMAIFILALIPLWLVYGYGLRKSYMLWKIRRYVRKHPQEASPSENADAPGSNRKLPRDIVFDEENDERTARVCTCAWACGEARTIVYVRLWWAVVSRISRFFSNRFDRPFHTISVCKNIRNF